MRILHVTDCYLPLVGGIELHVRDLAEQQTARGHEVAVATRTRAAEPDPDTGPRVVRTDRLRPIRWAGFEPDVVHAHVSVVSPFALAAARTASAHGLPTVVTVHSMWPDLGRGSAGPLAGLLRLRHDGIEWTAVSRAAAAPVESLIGRPVGVLPNAIDLAYWAPRPRPPAGSPVGGPVGGPVGIVSVMRLTRVKRALPLARLLRELSLHHDFHATIVGDGPQRGELERYLRRHGLSSRVELTGTLDRAAVREVVAAADLFVAPSRRESFGIAALEARSLGLPVLAHARSGVATFVQDGVDGALCLDDHDMTEALGALIESQALREQITTHNRLHPPPLDWTDLVTDNLAAYQRAGAPLADVRTTA